MTPTDFADKRRQWAHLPGPQIDAMFLMEATAALEAAANNPTDRQIWTEALRQNLMLWLNIGQTVGKGRNSLPRDIRKKLIKLSEFVKDWSEMAEDGSDGAMMRPLIQINNSIASWLFR